jgi:Kdo2-lipid IVA lauroyltransferase/acyltransferase
VKVSLAILLVKLLGKLPLTFRICIGSFFGYLYYLLPTREKRIAELQLKMIFPDKEPNQIIKKMFASIGQNALETLNLFPILTKSKNLIEVNDGWKELVKSSKNNQAIVALTAHTGNWDLLAAYTVQCGLNLYTAGKEAKSPWMQNMMNYLRTLYGVNTIWRTDKTGFKKIINALNNNAIVAALVDQDTNVRSEFVDFFSYPAHVPSGLIDIGKKKQAKFFAVFIFRSGRHKFNIFAKQINEQLSTKDILLEYHQFLEKNLTQYPEQWVWFHKRWRTLPNGYRMGSREYLSYLERTCS